MDYSILEEDTIQLEVFLNMKNELQRLDTRHLKRIYTLLGDREVLSRKARWDIFKKYHEGGLQYALFDKKRTGKPSPVGSGADIGIWKMYYEQGMSYKEIQRQLEAGGFILSVEAIRKRCQRYDKNNEISIVNHE